jgi:WD40 repeat protein
MELSKRWAAELDDYVIDLAWSPDGARIAAAAASGPIAVFSSDDGSKRHEFPGHDPGTNVLAWEPSSESASPASGLGRALASGGQDGAVKFWDAAAGQHTATVKLGAGWVEHLAWGSSTLAAACGRKFALLNGDGSTRHAFDEAAKTISALVWRPTLLDSGTSANRLALAFFGGVRLIDADDYSILKEFPYANGIQALTWSPDGKWLVSGNQDPSVHLWIPDRDEELQMSGFEGKVKYLSFDSTSRWLATSGGRDVSVWDCSGAGPEGREPATLSHETPVCAIAFQRSHGLLASAAKDGVVQLWSPERARPLRATIRLPAAATKLVWSSDDRLLAIGTEQGFLCVLACKG